MIKKTISEPFEFQSRRVNRFRDSNGSVELVSSRHEKREASRVELNEFDSDFFMAYKWGDNVCHWYFDVMACALFLKGGDPGFRSRHFLINPIWQNCRHVKDWLQILGVRSFSAVQIGDDDPKERTHVSFGEHFYGLCHPNTIQSLRRYAPIFNRSDTPKYILIQRCNDGPGVGRSRNLENRDEIESRFSSWGINLTTVYLEGTSVAQQISLFSNAKIIVGVHGAGMANVVFCNQDCRIVEIASPNFYNWHYAEIAGMAHLKFATLDASMVSSNPDPNASLVSSPSAIMDVILSLD